jgi:vacuolar-type H+-ATPase subunit C/Vma6
LFEDEDRRSIRNLLRGVVQGASVSARLTGLIPTRDLPERALEELAEQHTTLAVADLLATWGSPYGQALLKRTVEAPRDLLRLETAVNRCFAIRSSEAARRADGHLRAYVQQLVDLENAWAALLLAGQPDDVNRETVFLDGGRELTQSLFDAVVAEPEPPRAADRLAELFGASPLAPVFADYEVTRRRLEDEALISLIGHYTGEARRDPLGLAFAIAYVLRLRAESLDLRRIIWGVALHAPGATIVSAMVV